MTVDAILEYGKKLVLIKRKYPPCEGMWALPGGIVKMDETLEQAIKREVKEETGVDCKIKKLLGAFSAIDRDPRGRSISICYHCTTEQEPEKSSEEAKEIRLFSPSSMPELAFDHEKMIKLIHED